MLANVQIKATKTKNATPNPYDPWAFVVGLSILVIVNCGYLECQGHRKDSLKFDVDSPDNLLLSLVFQISFDQCTTEFNFPLGSIILPIDNTLIKGHL